MPAPERRPGTGASQRGQLPVSEETPEGGGPAHCMGLKGQSLPSQDPQPPPHQAPFPGQNLLPAHPGPQRLLFEAAGLQVWKAPLLRGPVCILAAPCPRPPHRWRLRTSPWSF